MDLTQELRLLRKKTMNRLEREKKRKRKSSLKFQSLPTQEQARIILRNLPKKLKNFANLSAEGCYEVMKIRNQHPLNTTPRHLSGVDRLVYKGCKDLGLITKIGASDGTSGESIWVYWPS